MKPLTKALWNVAYWFINIHSVVMLLITVYIAVNILLHPEAPPQVWAVVLVGLLIFAVERILLLFLLMDENAKQAPLRLGVY